MQICWREERASSARLLCAFCVCNILIVDENFGHIECGHSCHAALLLLVHCAAESTGPVQSVKEANNDVAPYSLFHTLQTCSTSKEFLEPMIC